MEAFYPIGFAIISVLINRIPRFHILCKPMIPFLNIAISFQKKNSIATNNNRLPLVLVFIFFTSGAAALICHFTDVPLVQAGALIYFELAGIAGNVVSTSTVEIFPTHIR